VEHSKTEKDRQKKKKREGEQAEPVRKKFSGNNGRKEGSVE